MKTKSIVDKKVTAETFWDTNLEDIEAEFLPNGTKVTDLPLYLDDRVPPGDILLSPIQNIDDIVPKPTLWQRIWYRLNKLKQYLRNAQLTNRKSRNQSTNISFEKNLVMKYSRNSIALQTGRYVTKEELERRKQEILKHKFI